MGFGCLWGIPQSIRTSDKKVNGVIIICNTSTNITTENIDFLDLLENIKVLLKYIKWYKNLKPGEITKKSGQYEIIGPRGGKTREEITSVKGKPLPPAQKPGTTYKLVDQTKR